MDINNDPASAGQTPPPPTPPAAPIPPPPGQNGPNNPNPNMGMAILAYLGILVIIPLLTEARHDPFVKFHIKQGLVLLIGFVFASALAMVPVFGWLLWVGCLVLMIMGIINVTNNKQVELPVIGQFARNFHF